MSGGILEAGHLRLADLAAGNLPEGSQLRMLSGTEQEVELAGRLHLNIVCTSRLNRQPGRPNPGQAQWLNSIAELNAAARAAEEAAPRDENLLAAAARAAAALPLKGWGVPPRPLPLAELSRTLAAAELCTPCRGEGAYRCAECAGDGDRLCTGCRGAGQLNCPQCHGSGIAGDGRACRACAGEGARPCGLCAASGRERCPACEGQGRVPCRECAGEGAQGAVLQLDYAVRPEFRMEFGRLSPRLVEALTRAGGAQVGREAREIMLGDLKDDELAYTARLMTGQARIEINGEAVECLLWGQKPRFAGLPTFLDAALKPGLKALARAATTRTHITGALQEACQHRILRDAIIAGFGDQVRSKSILAAGAPALSRAAAKTIAHDIRVSMLKLSARARRYGVFVGVLVALLVDWLWLFHLRAVMPGSEPLHRAADVAVMALGAGLSVASVGLLARRALRLAARTLGSVTADESLPVRVTAHSARVGVAGRVAAALAVVMFFGMTELAFRRDQAPHWYQGVRAALLSPPGKVMP